MHYPGHDNWQGMSYGLLDETPTLTRTPSNPTIGDYLAEFQDRNRAWRESLKFPEFTPNSGRLDPVEEVEEPEDDPILGPVVRKRILPVEFDENVEHPMPEMERTAANNWGYASDLERGLLGMALPFGSGYGIGAANNWEAMQMDRTGWGKQFSPGLFDVLTGGIFAGPGYKQSVLNMENRNIAGRRARGPGVAKFPFYDYTHQYGPGFMDDVKEYDPWDGVTYVDPSSVAAAQAVEDIAAAQEAAALASRDAITIPDTLFMSGDGDFGGYGGRHDEEAPGEMGGGVVPGLSEITYSYDDGFDHGMDYGGDFADDTMGGFDP